nr:MAG TPA: hypothetical protein [Caudoviricetes sp.]
MYLIGFFLAGITPDKEKQGEINKSALSCMFSKSEDPLH